MCDSFEIDRFPLEYANIAIIQQIIFVFHFLASEVTNRLYLHGRVQGLSSKVKCYSLHQGVSLHQYNFQIHFYVFTMKHNCIGNPLTRVQYGVRSTSGSSLVIKVNASHD